MINKALKDFIEAINARDNGTEAYDTQAQVMRVEGKTAWVHIPGGIDETPVELTIAAKAGDNVQIRVANGQAWLTGNGSAPPTDDTTAEAAQTTADRAEVRAQTAAETAAEAEAAAQAAMTFATTAEEAAEAAQESAQNASEYAARALGNLSTVQSVAETLTWITQHGTMTLTSDTALDPTHVYFVQDPGGDYVVGGVTYAVVTEPNVSEIGTYYELTIDESLNNYVGTHLALTSEGLWLLPATSGTNKVLIATGAGSTYTTAGTYLLGESGEILAQFTLDGLTVQTVDANDNTVEIANLGYGLGNAESGTAKKPYYTLGQRANNSAIGNWSVAEGYNTTASAYVSHAEGIDTTASGHRSHAEGDGATASGETSHAEGIDTTASNIASHAEGVRTTASGLESHAEGYITSATAAFSHAEGSGTVASGSASHAQNLATKAESDNQTAIGKFNIADSNDIYALIIGNGSADNARSNALAITWEGNIETALNTSAASGTVDGDLYAAITGLSWQSEVID